MAQWTQGHWGAGWGWDGWGAPQSGWSSSPSWSGWSGGSWGWGAPAAAVPSPPPAPAHAPAAHPPPSGQQQQRQQPVGPPAVAAAAAAAAAAASAAASAAAHARGPARRAETAAAAARAASASPRRGHAPAGGDVIGYVALSPTGATGRRVLGPDLQVMTICVAPEARRRGAASALWRAARDVALSAGLDGSMIVHVCAQNTAAINFYTKLGLQRRKKRSARMPLRGAPAVPIASLEEDELRERMGIQVLAVPLPAAPSQQPPGRARVREAGPSDAAAVAGLERLFVQHHRAACTALSGSSAEWLVALGCRGEQGWRHWAAGQERGCGAHSGEWREKRATHCSALDDEFQCKHGGVIHRPHWSCCGALRRAGTQLCPTGVTVLVAEG
eukprot:TRINITY_DN22727_c0_g1_i2.p1 TRINITY_DN22727_c0_g1~~TRINITY_DN22727_c0_g1_i2.p1  ORF type:complete len:413 (+),score=88.48 TRINITY_DN22727_c0_g1_i2:79-1239(+)